MALFKLIHLLSIVVWVGGMSFAYMILRPCVAEVLQAPERLKLWDCVFGRFFNWVWLAIFLTLVSGLYMIYRHGGLLNVPRYVYAMLLLGSCMGTVFVYMFFGQYVRFNLAVAAQDWTGAGEILALIRKIVALNLLLGVLTLAVVVFGRSL